MDIVVYDDDNVVHNVGVTILYGVCLMSLKDRGCRIVWCWCRIMLDWRYGVWIFFCYFLKQTSWQNKVLKTSQEVQSTVDEKLSGVSLRTITKGRQGNFWSPSVRLPRKTTTHCHHTHIHKKSDLVEVSLLTFTHILTRHTVLSVWVHVRPLSGTWANFQPVITTARWLVRGGGGGPASAQLTILHVVYKLVCSSEEARQTVL